MSKNKLIGVIYDHGCPFKAAICLHESGKFIVGFDAEYIDPQGYDLDGEGGHTGYGLWVYDTFEEAAASVGAHERVEWAQEMVITEEEVA